MRDPHFMTIDLFFSYWVIAWTFFYILFYTITKSKTILYFNPIVAIMVSILSKFILLGFILRHIEEIWKNRKQQIHLVLFVLVFTILYSTSIYWILLHKNRPPVYWGSSMLCFFLVLFLYYLWIVWNGNSIKSVYEKMYDSIIHADDNTPLMYLISKYLQGH